MTPQEFWLELKAHWWAIHFILLGILVGGSLGMWAYRNLWYGLATFFAAPVPTRSFWKALRQQIAATLLTVPAALAIALFLTAPLVYASIADETRRYIAVATAAGIWMLLRLFGTYGQVLSHKPSPPTPVRNPFSWAHYHSSQSPDTLPSGWLDLLMGLLLHAGLGVGWYELKQHAAELPSWAPAAGVAASIAYIVLVTGLSVLMQPPAVSHD